MCLIGLALLKEGPYRLVLAANRDEFFERESAAPAWWLRDADASTRQPSPRAILGGRDLRAGGTWLGLTRGGRFAALTNLRQPQRSVPAQAPSRGNLVADFLLGDVDAADYGAEVQQHAASYAGFNLLLGELHDPPALRVVSSHFGAPRPLAYGVHAVSNGLLDDHWPKCQALGSAIGSAMFAITRGAAVSEFESSLFEALADRTMAPDDRLPHTGVGVERERLLSPAFLVGASLGSQAATGAAATSGTYGTRNSTLLLVTRVGEVTMVDRSWRPDGQYTERRFEFVLQED